MKKQNNSYECRGCSRLTRSFLRPLTLFIFSLSIILPLTAKRVTRQEAFNIAKKYVITSSNRRLTLGAQSRLPKKNSVEPFYVFNDEKGKGFVVVSGDDALGEVLAYSDSGVLDTLNAHPGIKFLLQTYRESFAQLQQTATQMQPATRATETYKAVAPLLSCKWSQDFPYNKQIGYDYTGCVATAMAQMMYFHKWPAQGKGENTYTITYDQQQKHADFSKSHYDWEHMKDRYSYAYPWTDDEANAVALLMHDLGVATNMQYTPHASGTQNENADRAFQKYFDYTTAFVKRSDEGTSGFTQIVRQELLNGFPVYLAGFYKLGAGGHAWVTDGVDERGLFHMNFGWGGQSDGYFSLTAADVAKSGNEFGGRPLSFKIDLTAILAHPNKEGVKPIDPSLLPNSPKLRFNGEGSLTLPEGHQKTFAAAEMPPVEMAYFVNKGNPFRGDIGVGVYNMDGQRLKICPSDDYEKGGFTQRVYGLYDNGLMNRDYLINTPQKIKIDLSGLSDGYYQLLPICAPKKADGDWGDWVRMKLAPRMVIELNKGIVRVTEEGSFQAGFQLLSHPIVTRFTPGSEEKVVFSIRNKGGLERTCYAKLQLLDEAGNVAHEIRKEEKTDFPGFDTTLLPFTISIPESFTEGSYQVKLILIQDDGTNIDDPEASQHHVEKVNAKEETIFMISSQVTGIEDTAKSSTKIAQHGNNLMVRAHNLQWVKLFDLNGRLLKHRSVGAGNALSISLIDLEPGVYIVEIGNNGGSHRQRILKR